MEISIHIHEDDWAMRNLYPLEALADAAIDVDKAAEAGMRNRSADGIGWTDVHLIGQPSTNYAAVGLRWTDAAAVLATILPRIRKFTATATPGFDPAVRDAWGSYEEDAHCYGFGASCFIKLETEGDMVKQIWFECTTQDLEQVAALRSVLVALNNLVPSAIADYWNDMAGAIQDPVFLDRYFEELTQPEA